MVKYQVKAFGSLKNHILLKYFCNFVLGTIYMKFCLYFCVATCTDGIHTPDENGIDCGGPCIACQSCNDDIQNQGETGVDCGGPCTACPTCEDDIKNQGETGVDCGGPCTMCQGIKN